VPEGAFGEFQAEALQGAGQNIQNLGETLQRQEMQRIERQDNANLGRAKLAIDNYILQEKQAFANLPYRDQQDKIIDHSGLAAESLEKFNASRVNSLASELQLQESHDELSIYYGRRALELKKQAIIQSEAGRADEAKTTLLGMGNSLANFQATNPGFQSDPVLMEEFNDRVLDIRRQLRDMEAGNQISQEDRKKFDLKLSDTIGGIAIDQEISRIKNLGDASHLQELIAGIRGNKYHIKPGNVQKYIDKAFDETKAFYTNLEKDDDKQRKIAQDSAASSFYRRMTEGGIAEGETAPTYDEFLDLTTPQTRTEMIDGREVTITTPPIVTKPAMVKGMRDALDGKVAKEGTNAARDYISRLKFREPRLGFTDKQTIDDIEEKAITARLQNEISPSDLETVSSEIKAWRKELETDAGKEVAKAKKDITGKLKARILRSGDLLSKFTDDDVVRRELLSRLNSIAIKRIDEGEANRKAGKKWETPMDIWFDMDKRLINDAMEYLFPQSMREDLVDKLKNKKPMSELDIERWMLLDKQDKLLLAENARTARIEQDRQKALEEEKKKNEPGEFKQFAEEVFKTLDEMRKSFLGEITNGK